LDAVGFPALGSYSPVLQDAVFRKIVSGPPPAPELITYAQAMTGDFDSQMVSLEGTAVHTARSRDRSEFIFNTGKGTFTAEIDTGADNDLLHSMPSESRVRITGQLIDATTGASLWAGRFESTLNDIFDLQDQMTSSVVAALMPRLEQALQTELRMLG